MMQRVNRDGQRPGHPGLDRPERQAGSGARPVRFRGRATGLPKDTQPGGPGPCHRDGNPDTRTAVRCG